VRVVAVVMAVAEIEVVPAGFEVGAVLQVVWEMVLWVEAKLLAVVRVGMGSEIVALVEIAIEKDFPEWVEPLVLRIRLLRLVDAQHLEA